VQELRYLYVKCQFIIAGCLRILTSISVRFDRMNVLSLFDGISCGRIALLFRTFIFTRLTWLSEIQQFTKLSR